MKKRLYTLFFKGEENETLACDYFDCIYFCCCYQLVLLEGKKMDFEKKHCILAGIVIFFGSACFDFV